jgi:hypothetical protein
MSDIEKKSEVAGTAADQNEDRRQALRRMGRFAAVTAPSVALLLAAGSKPSQAQTRVSNPDPGGPISSRQFKISEGAVDSSHALAVAMSSHAAADVVDGVGLCLAAVKDLVQRIESLESQLAIR